ncbi:M48 family metallopeptidase [Paludibaculum fermentans]|uniref:M48 family metallopeptidase n=1 Tax=Paludibaculum fermentans TaxID=1473598 RepID=UPI003EB80124
MSDRILLLITMGALALSGILVRAGKIDDKQDLESVATLWSDLFSDAARTSGALVHVSIAEETALGNRLAAGAYSVWGEESTGLPRVAGITANLSQHVRRPMTYTAHIVSGSAINAFSLPGGHIYVTSGLLGFVQTDDELAGVLGHEMAHVDLKHCLDQHRYEAALSGHRIPDAGVLLDLVRQAAAVTYSQQQEFDADTRGAYLAALAGYNAKQMPGVFRRLDQLTRTNPRRGFIRPYFESHPSSAVRAARLAEAVAQPVGR